MKFVKEIFIKIIKYAKSGIDKITKNHGGNI